MSAAELPGRKQLYLRLRHPCLLKAGKRKTEGLINICIPFMGKGAKILNISSAPAFQPVPYINLYAAVKQAFEANEATMSRIVSENGSAYYKKMSVSNYKIEVKDEKCALLPFLLCRNKSRPQVTPVVLTYFIVECKC